MRFSVAQLLSFQILFPVAVSYTHLDVYKRQDRNYQKKKNAGRDKIRNNTIRSLVVVEKYIIDETEQRRLRRYSPAKRNKEWKINRNSSELEHCRKEQKTATFNYRINNGDSAEQIKMWKTGT